VYEGKDDEAGRYSRVRYRVPIVHIEWTDGMSADVCPVCIHGMYVKSETSGRRAWWLRLRRLTAIRSAAGWLHATDGAPTV
jgi:hypothetical protein